MADTVILDAMIMRDDFAVTAAAPPSAAEPIKALSIENITGQSMLVQLLRKPDFQRETNQWTPVQLVTFLESFLDNELIPSVILWQSDAFVFVIDGGHRLSALRAWIEDDYGDGPISRAYFGNEISVAQKKVAKKAKDLVAERVGTYKDVKAALINQAAYDERTVARAKNMATRSLSLQWVTGDAAKAETSFFKINTQGTPLDKTEELILQNRYRSVAVSARSIVRAGTGHKYWSKFPSETKQKIESNAARIHNALFNPEVDHPIKTLDLPLGGSRSPISALEMLMSLISITNAPIGTTKRPLDSFEEDVDGQKTLAVLDQCFRVVGRMSGNEGKSLGLHPAIYFYSERGRHIPDLLLGMLLLIRRKLQNNDPNFFKKFSENRRKIEDYLLSNKALITQAMQLARSAVRYERAADLFDFLVAQFSAQTDFTEEQMIKVIAPNSVAKLLAVAETATTTKFSDETKSTIFLRQAFKTTLTCAICNGYLDAAKSASYDHIDRVQDGGLGDATNGQITHPYCNTAMKN